MRTWTVGDVMTRTVATVRPDTPYRDVVDVLTAMHINAVPVIDKFDLVLGVVSEADLLHKVELIGQRHERRVFEGRRRRNARAKADGTNARDFMTSPAVTTYPHASIVSAALIMTQQQVKFLPVLNDLGRLVGVVSRGDLLKVHLRPDAGIQRDILEMFGRVLEVDEGVVTVEVREGVVKLIGRLDRQTSAEHAKALAANVGGVVAVIDELTFAVADSNWPEFRSAAHTVGVV